MNLASAESAKVEVFASHPRFAIPMYTGTQVKVEIDGEPSTFPWGHRSFDVAPGRHSVTVSYAGFMNPGSPEWIWVEVEAGGTARVTYRAPTRGTQSGTIESDSAVPEPDDGPDDLSGLSDAELIEAWNDFKQLAGRDPFKRLLLRKMRAEFEQEIGRRGLPPASWR